MREPLTPEELLHASWFEHDESMKHFLGAIRKEAVELARLAVGNVDQSSKEYRHLYNILILTAPVGDNPPEREFKIKVAENLL